MKNLLLLFSLLLTFTSTSLATDYFISPTGSDVAAGTTSAPWKTFARAISTGSPKLGPGDTLYLKDGTYTSANSGLPAIGCNSGANDGSAGNPITIQAEHERQAILQGNGIQHTFRMLFCDYWNIVGIRFQSADNSGGAGDVFYITDSTHLTIRRNIFAYNNRYFNTGSFTVERVFDSLIEENEMYYYFRNGYMAFGSDRNTFRRNYANSRNYADIIGGYVSGNTDRGDTGFTCYPCSSTIWENNISENNGAGFDIEPNGTTLDNAYYGNVSLHDTTGWFIQARGGDLNHMARNTVIKDQVVIGEASGAQNIGLYLRGTKNTQVTNVSIFGTERVGSTADQPSPPESGDGSPSAFLTNVLVTPSKTEYDFLFTNQADFLCDYCAGTNFQPTAADLHITHEFTSAPTSLGSSYVWIAPASNLKGVGRNGADIGANILYRYINGQLTTEPLWNPVSGVFPCGAIVRGLNDVAGSSCFDVNVRLNVSANTLPPGYGGSILSVSPPTNVRLVQTVP